LQYDDTIFNLHKIKECFFHVNNFNACFLPSYPYPNKMPLAGISQVPAGTGGIDHLIDDARSGIKEFLTKL